VGRRGNVAADERIRMAHPDAQIDIVLHAVRACQPDPSTQTLSALLNAIR
jgi:hypothetical protein